MISLDMKYLLLSHCFIRNTNELGKIKIFNSVIQYFRSNYKDIFIVVTGHGIPVDGIIGADHIIWLDLIESELGKGHPICVKRGLSYLKKHGALNILKMRLDSLSVRDDIFEYCSDVLRKENTLCLVTAQTDVDTRIGDLFLYGDINFLLSIWTPETWGTDTDGCFSLMKNFKNRYTDKNFKEVFSYRDVCTLRWLLIQNVIPHDELKDNYGNYLWDNFHESLITEEYYYDKR